ncbi:MAG TPA: zf-HC2 domain-containing protein, partial [Baekduia sp.]|nr:zf-HC2 domain-containing protein [Baekduia sp.]
MPPEDDHISDAITRYARGLRDPEPEATARQVAHEAAGDVTRAVELVRAEVLPQAAEPFGLSVGRLSRRLCADVPTVLLAKLEGRLTPEDAMRLDDHVASCRACRPFVATAEAAEHQLAVALGLAPEAEPDAASTGAAAAEPGAPQWLPAEAPAAAAAGSAQQARSPWLPAEAPAAAAVAVADADARTAAAHGPPAPDAAARWLPGDVATRPPAPAGASPDDPAPPTAAWAPVRPAVVASPPPLRRSATVSRRARLAVPLALLVVAGGVVVASGAVLSDDDPQGSASSAPPAAQLRTPTSSA